MAQVHLVKDHGVLKAADEDTETVLNRIKDGEVVKCTVTKSRSFKQLRLFWSLIGIVQENCDLWPTKEACATAFKIELGYCDAIRLPNGHVILQARSIAIDSMEQLEFTGFFEAAIDLIVSKIIPGVDKADLEREVFERIGLGAAIERSA